MGSDEIRERQIEENKEERKSIDGEQQNFIQQRDIEEEKNNIDEEEIANQENDIAVDVDESENQAEEVLINFPQRLELGASLQFQNRVKRNQL